MKEHPFAALASHAQAARRPRLRWSSFGHAAAVTPSQPISPMHNGRAGDVLLQGFHRSSSQSQNPSWHAIVAQNAQRIRDAGFTLVWLPPTSPSVDPWGYMPTLWNTFDGKYGTKGELVAAISALGPVRAIADVVVNHRCGAATAGVDFEDPPFALADQALAVCSNDKVELLGGEILMIGKGQPDTGDDALAAHDLDHTNPVVQNAIVDFLGTLAGLGFKGWRYDMTKGYAGRFVGSYNQRSNPDFSVGEYWDGDRQAIMNFIDATGGQSMAFDFPTRMLLKEAIGKSDFAELRDGDGRPGGALGWWPAMSVTFLENHDTEESDAFGNGDQVMMGYAYLLTHPGIPSIFWPHFFDWGQEIRSQLTTLIAVREKSGINRDSHARIVEAGNGLYAAIIDDKVAMKLGPAPWSPDASWTLATSGNDYAVWTR